MKYLLISYELACYQQWLWYSESLCLEIRSRWGITGTATSKSPSKLVAWNGIHKKIHYPLEVLGVEGVHWGEEGKDTTSD